MRKIIFKSAFVLMSFLFVSALNVEAQQIKSSGFKNPVVFINLMLPSADTLLLIDGTAAMYSKNFSDAIDEYDAGKLPNFNENICLMRDNQKLAIEARKIPTIFNDTLFINMWGMKKQTYELQITPQNLQQMPMAGAWLYDKYADKKIALDFYEKTFYNFIADADINSYQNRFMIVFNRKTYTAEPVSVNKQFNINGTIQVYPNPLTGNILKLQFNNMAKDNYYLKLSNLSGKIILNKNIIHSGGNNEYYIQLNGVYSPGIYSITISGKSAEKTIHLPLIIN